jgi:Tfp pilus assembly protein PilO
MSIVERALGKEANAFYMHVLVAIVVGVVAASFTTYIQQARLEQTQKAQGKSIEALKSQQQRQRATLQVLSRQMRGVEVKINLLLDAQGIASDGAHVRESGYKPVIDSIN